MNRHVGPIIGALIGLMVLQSTASGQDVAWEGLINAGRNALQQRKFSEAERHFEAALEAAERFPSDDARLGKSYNNLAAVYYAQEDFERAEPLMRRALAQLRETLGPKNTEVAQTMKNLAALYFLQGNRSEAEALLKQSLEILEDVHGPNHAFVATVLSNLAGLYQSENRFADAEPLLTRSLRIWEGLLGSDHPDVVRSRALLAEVRQAEGGNRSPGTATAAVNPRASAPNPVDEAGSGDDDSQNSETKSVEETARAKTALEKLTELSKIEADNARAGTLSVPGLSPIDDAANARTDGALSTETGEASEPSSVAAAPGDDTVEGDIITSALDAPTGAEGEAASVTAKAILDQAASADDVSFAVYLSTLWSMDEARLYWQSMQDAMPDVLSGKQLQIEEIAVAGGTDPFYRVLTTPYSSDPEAQAACDLIKLKLRTHDCSVVVREAAAGG